MLQRDTITNPESAGIFVVITGYEETIRRDEEILMTYFCRGCILSVIAQSCSQNLLHSLKTCLKTVVIRSFE